MARVSLLCYAIGAQPGCVFLNPQKSYPAMISLSPVCWWASKMREASTYELIISPIFPCCKWMLPIRFNMFAIDSSFFPTLLPRSISSASKKQLRAPSRTPDFWCSWPKCRRDNTTSGWSGPRLKRSIRRDSL